MKSKTVIISLAFATALLCLSFSPDRTNRSARKIMNEYRGERGFFSFSVPMFVVKPFISKEDKDVRDLLCDIRKVQLLVCDDVCNNSRMIRNCVLDFSSYFRESGYEEIMVVNDGDETVLIHALPEKNGFRDMIMIVSSNEDFVVIQLTGSLNGQALIKLMDEERI